MKQLFRWEDAAGVDLLLEHFVKQLSQEAIVDLRESLLGALNAVDDEERRDWSKNAAEIMFPALIGKLIVCGEKT